MEFVEIHEVPKERLDRLANEYIRKLQRESYARHPERVMRNRLLSAARLLNRQGLLSDAAAAAIIDTIKGGAFNG